MTCEWCGHEHAVTALCTQRPKWSRRGFISLLGAGVAGLALPAPTATPMVAVIPAGEIIGPAGVGAYTLYATETGIWLATREA